MKNIIHSLLGFFLMFACTASTLAQTPLPYYSGFDNPTERSGWAQFTTGSTSGYAWSITTGASYVSPMSALESPSAEFTSPGDTIVQWYVSPGFNFASGGNVDSFAINVFQPTGVTFPSDSIVLYLLAGSNNPTTATSKIRLANLTGMVTSGSAFRDTGNFHIPPTPGVSYIAFKYYSVNDWYQVTVDNIHISGSCTLPVVSFTKTGSHTVTFMYTGTTGTDSLRWSFGDGSTSTATNPAHTYSSSGTYTACITAYTNCGSDTTCHSVTVNTSSIPIYGAAVELNIYPNPVAEQLIIDNAPIGSVINLYSITGQRQYGDIVSSDVQVIDMHQLRHGIYTLQLTDPQGNRTNRIIAKE